MEDSRSAETPPPTGARARRARVAAVIPCFNRPHDLGLLLGDLAAQTADAELRILVVDNASAPPLAPHAPDDPPLNAPPRVEVLRLDANVGGSGGFNAGMAHILRHDDADFIWLLDSDARAEPGALAALLDALQRRPDAAIAGSALAEPGAASAFELGGFIDRSSGELVQPLPGAAPPGHTPPPAGVIDPLREVEYVAACSMLVRREAIEASGLMADLFVSSDDAEWCLRIARRTGMKVLAVAKSVARHPDPDKMRTWARYDVARNCLVACEALGLGRRVRWRRAMREVARALAQNLVGRDDLAELHLRGLEDLAAGRIGPAARAGRITFERPRPLSDLPQAIEQLRRQGGEPALSPELRRLPSVAREALARAGIDINAGPGPEQAPDVAPLIVHLIGGPQPRTAIASGRARPGDWLLGRHMILVAEDGFVERRLRWLAPLGACLRTLLRGGRLAATLALRGPGAQPLVPPAPLPEQRHPRLSLSIIILSYNRRDALLATLTHLRAGRFSRSAEIIIVDNASTDGSSDAVREWGSFASEWGSSASCRPCTSDSHGPLRIIELPSNTGVAGFNRGAEAATGDTLLILDDDSWPDDTALGRALALLEQRPDIAAVSLLPRHPQTLRPEWPFARVLGGAPRDDWPVMGCGNLVRRSAWVAVGGYEEGFFLYRNDVDLALKLLGAGHKGGGRGGGGGVWFDPTWVVWHDSPAAAHRRKSLRWFELATRNWIWLARRHGRGGSKWLGIALGWANAHRLAGLSLPAHAAVLRGAWKGLIQRPAPAAPATGAGWRALLRLRRTRLAPGQAPPPARR